MTTERAPTDRELRIATWELSRVAEAVDGALSGARAGGPAPSGVSSDTRTLSEGEFFVALRGENFDGHEFVEQARKKGACGALVERDYPTDRDGDFPLVRVDDTHEGLIRLGHAIWREATEEGLHTIDVTGSNGKTTTKELLAAIWGSVGAVFATPGNLNNAIGVPLTLCALPVDCRHLIVEMGANAQGEIAELIRMAPGSERLITSIGRAHTEGFGSIEGIRRAKSEIFEVADRETTAIVPTGEVERLELDGFPGAIRTVGEEHGSDIRLVDYAPEPAQTGLFRATYEIDGQRFTLPLGLPGRHNGLNLGMALATMVARGRAIDADRLADPLSGIELPAGRWRRSTWRSLEIIDDAYNANPSSMRASFRAFMAEEPAELANQAAALRRVAIIGDMCELGEQARRWHCDVAVQIAREPDLDALCVVGEFADPMAAAVRQDDEAAVDLKAHTDVDAIVDWLRDQQPGFVWMKASRQTALERITERLREQTDD